MYSTNTLSASPVVFHVEYVYSISGNNIFFSQGFFANMVTGLKVLAQN